MLPDDIHIIVCSYLEYIDERMDYLKYCDRYIKLKYMCTFYTINNKDIEHSKIRYLQLFTNALDLSEYKNLYSIHFIYTNSFNETMDMWNLPSTVKKISITKYCPTKDRTILENWCGTNNIKLILR